MANEQSGSPLRRWRQFYGAFGAIDEAIEAVRHPRAAFRDVRVRIVLLLRAATDDGVAEQLCAALDDTMAESLQTLKVAPVPHGALASTDLARVVRALGKHGSARIRSLASDVVRGWRTANDVATATAVKELDKLSGGPVRISTATTAAADVHKMKLQVTPAKILPAAAATEEHKKKLYGPRPKMFTTATIVSGRQNTSDTKMPIVAQREKLEVKKPVVAQSKKFDAKKPVVAQSKKLEAKKLIVAQSEKIDAKKPIILALEAKKQPVITESVKMETTKRKLREGYEEAKNMKRQHTIQKIEGKEAPKLLERSQQKMHRSPARCRTSSGVRRSLLPALQLI